MSYGQVFQYSQLSYHDCYGNFLMFQVFLSDLVYHYLESYQPLITKIKQEMYILDILVTLD